MSQNDHSLYEIPHSEWKKLRDLYLSDWPNNLLGYYTLDNFINWINLEPEIKDLIVYSLDGNWSDGTFLVLNENQIFLNTLSKTNDRLKIAISLLDWTKSYTFSSFLERHRPAVIDVIESKNIQKSIDAQTQLYYLPASEGKKININCPENVILKNLTEADVETVHNIWPHRRNDTENFIKGLINRNLNVGAYSRDNNELMAWCLRIPGGPLGALQTKSHHLRKGLGSLVTKAMIQKLAANNEDTCACIITDNVPSKKLFQKLGFKEIDNVYWLVNLPLNSKIH